MSRIIEYLLLGFLICCVLVECKKKDDDEEEGGGGKCIAKDPVAVDEKLGIEQVSKKDAYLVMMRKRMWGPESFATPPKKDTRKWKHTFCFEGTANTELGDFRMKGKISYNKANEMYLLGSFGQTDGLGGVGDLKGAVDGWIALTDNKTFALAVACINGDTPAWMVVSTKKEISKDEEKKVLERIVQLGFKEDEVEPKENYKGSKVKKTDCSKIEDGDKDGGLVKGGKGKKGADLGDLGGIGR